MIEATLKAKPAGCWIISFLEKHPDVRITVMDCRMLEDGSGVQHLFEVVAPQQVLDIVAKSILEDPKLQGVELITSQKGRIHGSIKILNHSCGFSNMRDLHLRSVNTLLDGTIEWNVLGGNESLHRLLKSFDREGVPVEVTRITGFNGTSLMTPRQELILHMAFEKGYFESPKKINLEELGELTGTTPATLTEILRKGLSKVLRLYFNHSSTLQINSSNDNSSRL